MQVIKSFFIFLYAFPELWALFKSVQKELEERQLDAKIKDEFKEINEIFKKRDAEALNKLFTRR